MRKQMIENAVYDVATQVRSVEDCIESALAEIAELQGRMVRARSVAGMGIGPSHEPFEKLAVANQALVGARGSMAGCHAALVEAQRFVPGMREVAFGDVVPCPEKTGSANLRVVA
jgi:hypothetical protein